MQSKNKNKGRGFKDVMKCIRDFESDCFGKPIRVLVTYPCVRGTLYAFVFLLHMTNFRKRHFEPTVLIKLV